jgi:hypothetical protein
MVPGLFDLRIGLYNQLLLQVSRLLLLLPLMQPSVQITKMSLQGDVKKV